MAEVQFTENQCAAIDAQGGAVLVSAAAGSGKTALPQKRLKVIPGRIFNHAERAVKQVLRFIPNHYPLI